MLAIVPTELRTQVPPIPSEPRKTDAENLIIPSVGLRIGALEEYNRRQKGKALQQQKGPRPRPCFTLSREFGCEGYPVAVRLLKLMAELTGDQSMTGWGRKQSPGPLPTMSPPALPQGLWHKVQQGPEHDLSQSCGCTASTAPPPPSPPPPACTTLPKPPARPAHSPSRGEPR